MLFLILKLLQGFSNSTATEYADEQQNNSHNGRMYLSIPLHSEKFKKIFLYKVISHN